MLIGYLFFDLFLFAKTPIPRHHIRKASTFLGQNLCPFFGQVMGVPHILEMDLQHLLDGDMDPKDDGYHIDGCPIVFGWISHIANSLKDDMNPRFLMAIRSFDRFFVGHAHGLLEFMDFGVARTVFSSLIADFHIFRLSSS